MANVDTGTAPHQSISDYGLSRQVAKPRHRAMDFMGPYTNQVGENQSFAWASYTIRQSNSNHGIVFYSVSTLFNAYVTEAAYLTTEEEDDERVTPMRYRDMMLDSYLDAGGDLKDWRYIGAKALVNGETRASALECFRWAGKDFTQAGSVEVLPKDKEIFSTALANPFTGGVQRLLCQYEEEMGYARIKKIIFISMGVMPKAVVSLCNPLVHLVIELCRPDDHGYPDGQAS
ncbi:hypothetical protein F5B18DRAFT_672673 [Nemania serpens]|nr:hypothetical protein F5B18DRAFT_672673 [Nemania serpens]